MQLQLQQQQIAAQAATAELMLKQIEKLSEALHASAQNPGATAVPSPLGAAPEPVMQQLPQPLEPLQPAKLSADNLRQHTRNQNHGSQSAATGSRRHPSPPQTSGWALSGGATAGSNEFHLSTYAGLHVGDVLELDPGLPTAEAVTIAKFGSIFTASPLRFDHTRGAQVRRLIEGNGPSRSTPVEQEHAQRQRFHERSTRGRASTAEHEDPDL